jgi:hypothetical protein
VSRARPLPRCTLCQIPHRGVVALHQSATAVQSHRFSRRCPSQDRCRPSRLSRVTVEGTSGGGRDPVPVGMASPETVCRRPPPFRMGYCSQHQGVTHHVKGAQRTRGSHQQPCEGVGDSRSPPTAPGTHELTSHPRVRYATRPLDRSYDMMHTRLTLDGNGEPTSRFGHRRFERIASVVR